MKKVKILVSLVLTLTLSFTANAQEGERSSKDDELAFYHASIFIGASSNLSESSTDLALGLDYEYRLPFVDYMFGTGFFIEGVFAEHKENLVGVPIYIHPYMEEFKFWLAPGVKFGEETVNGESQSEAEKTEMQTHFLFRLGAAYIYHYNMFTISPAVSFDIAGGEASFVYGLSLGMSL